MEFESRGTPAHVREAVKGFVRRNIGWVEIVLTVVALPFCLYLHEQGGRTWIGWTLLALIAAYWIMIWVIWWRHLQVGMKRLEGSEGWAMCEITDAGLRIRSRKEGYLLPWDRLKGIWRFPTTWLLFISRYHYIILPMDQASDEVRQALLSRAPKVDRSMF